jgi:glucose/arabinose dehydrogenase
MRLSSTLVRAGCLVGGFASYFCSAPDALAQHKTNPGPADFALKFKLPPPKPLSPDEALKTFAIQEGYRIELVAAEPLIEAPVAISFDDQGRLYVVEMRGYMHDVPGSTEQEPTGRISLLEDTDGDGRMDKTTVFLDNLVMPRSVMAVNGGALVAEPPNLFFCKDTDGDGKADTKEIVATDYGTFNGQHEHMANTPVWAMDNWIWSAKYNTKFRLMGGLWQKGPGLGRGQYGLCQDDAGRLFYNYNSDFLRADLLQGDALSRNPQLRNPTSLNSKVVNDQTVWPSHPTPGVNRGYGEILRPDGTLQSSTATCGALIYRGHALPADARGNAFIPEPAGNLVKRFRIQ